MDGEAQSWYEAFSMSDDMVTPTMEPTNPGNGTDIRTQAAIDRSACNFNKFIVHTVFAGIICLIGFVGNILSMIVLTKDRQSPVASFLLQWLAAVDNMFLVVWFLQFSIDCLFKYTGLFKQVHTPWIYIRLYTFPMLYCSQTATIWVTVVIAFSRYVAVCKPYQASQLVCLPNMKKAVIGTLVF